MRQWTLHAEYHSDTRYDAKHTLVCEKQYNCVTDKKVNSGT